MLILVRVSSYSSSEVELILDNIAACVYNFWQEVRMKMMETEMQRLMLRKSTNTQ